MKMSQKKFTFNDEDEDTNDIYQSHIDKYDSYYQQTPKTKQINQPHKKATVPTTKQPLPQKKKVPKHDDPHELEDQKVVQHYKKPKTKVKKKVKKKTKNKVKTKVIKEKRKRSWFSTFFLFLLSLLIIAGVCFGGYVAYHYYLKQQNQIEELQQQLQESKQDQQQDSSTQQTDDQESNSTDQEDKPLDDNNNQTIPQE